MNIRDLLHSVPLEAVWVSDIITSMKANKQWTDITMGYPGNIISDLATFTPGEIPTKRAFLIVVDNKALIETAKKGKEQALPLQRKGTDIRFSAEALEDGALFEFSFDKIWNYDTTDDVLYVNRGCGGVPVKLSTLKVLLDK